MGKHKTKSWPEKMYFFQEGLSGPIKIGMSKQPEVRLRDLQAKLPRRVRLIGVSENNEEKEWHRRFEDIRLNGEWFCPSKKLVEAIKECCGKNCFEKESTNTRTYLNYSDDKAGDFFADLYDEFQSNEFLNGLEECWVEQEDEKFDDELWLHCECESHYAERGAHALMSQEDRLFMVKFDFKERVITVVPKSGQGERALADGLEKAFFELDAAYWGLNLLGT